MNNFLPSVLITAYRDFQRKKGSLSTALYHNAKIAIPIKWTTNAATHATAH